MKSKTYTQNKQPSDKTQSSKVCQLGVKRTRFQNQKKKGNDFFDRSTTLKARETEGLSNAKVVGRYLFINNEKYDCRNIPEYLK